MWRSLLAARETIERGHGGLSGMGRGLIYGGTDGFQLLILSK